MQFELSSRSPVSSQTIGTSPENLEVATLSRSTNPGTSLNRLSPVSAFRSLLGAMTLGLVGLSGATANAASPQMPWRAQWGDPNYVTVTGQGKTYTMTYTQFFQWVGPDTHPNTKGIKVVGELPAHIAAQKKENKPAQQSAPKPQRQQSQPGGNQKMTPQQYAAWHKYYQDVAAYQKQMAQYLNSVAPSTTTPQRVYYPQYSQPNGPVQGGFLTSLKGLGREIGAGIKKLGGSVQRPPAQQNYTQSQLLAANIQAPRYVTPPQTSKPVQKTATSAPTTKHKASSTPAPKPQVKTPAKASAAPKKQAAPAPKPEAAEPDMPTFDVSQLKGTPDLLTLPGRGDLSAEGTPE